MAKPRSPSSSTIRPGNAQLGFPSFRLSVCVSTIRSFPRIRRSHLVTKAQILPDRVNLFFGVAVVEVGQWAAATLKILRHLGLRIDAERIAQPALKIRPQQTRRGVGEVDAFALEHFLRFHWADAMTGDAGVSARFADEFVADRRRVHIDGRFRRSLRWEAVLHRQALCEP